MRNCTSTDEDNGPGMEVDSGLYYVPEGLKQTIHLGRLLDEVIAFVRRYRYMYIRYLYRYIITCLTSE